MAIHYLKLRDLIRDGEEEQALTEEQLQDALNGTGLLDGMLPADQMAFAAAAQQQQLATQAAEEGSPSTANSPASGEEIGLIIA